MNSVLTGIMMGSVRFGLDSGGAAVYNMNHYEGGNRI